MSTINEKQNESNQLNQGIIFIYAVIFIFARYFNENSFFVSILLLIDLIVVLLNSTRIGVVSLLFTAFISDNMLLIPGVSYESILDVIVVVKLALNVGIKKNFFFSSLAIIFIQFLSIITFSNSAMNVIGFFIRIYLLYFIVEEYDYLGLEATLPVICLLSVTAGCCIGLLNYNSFNRFSGIWNDENFCGMYCLLAIFSAFQIIINSNSKIKPLALICCAICAYSAVKTGSRSFIFITVFIATLFFVFYLFEKNYGFFKKIVFLAVFIAFAIIMIRYGFTYIVNSRGLISTEADWTNGRLGHTINAIKVFWNDECALLFGCGINNVPSMMRKHNMLAAATHNTFADYILQFGIIPGIGIYIFIIKYLFEGLIVKVHKNASYWLPMIIFIYGICLSLLQYSIYYVLIAFYLGRLKRDFKKTVQD